MYLVWGQFSKYSKTFLSKCSLQYLRMDFIFYSGTFWWDLMLIFSSISTFSTIFLQDNHQKVDTSGSRSSSTFCCSWSGSELLVNAILFNVYIWNKIPIILDFIIFRSKHVRQDDSSKITVWVSLSVRLLIARENAHNSWTTWYIMMHVNNV